MQQRPDGQKDAAKVRDQQHTGNHQDERPERQTGGSDRFGGTRAGAENVEPVSPEDARKRPGR